MISFYSSSSLEWKMEVIQLIDSLNANEKVGEIWIALTDDNPISNEIVEWMNQKWRNVYEIGIGDELDRIDEGIHNQLKTMVE
jgi:hypothetical protein